MSLGGIDRARRVERVFVAALGGVIATAAVVTFLTPVPNSCFDLLVVMLGAAIVAAVLAWIVIWNTRGTEPDCECNRWPNTWPCCTRRFIWRKRWELYWILMISAFALLGAGIAAFIYCGLVV